MSSEVDFTGHRARPKHVLRAILTGDTKKLREYGQHGAAARNRQPSLRCKKVPRNVATEVRRYLKAMSLRVGLATDLAVLRNLYRETMEHLRPHRGRLTAALQQRVAELRDAFITRAAWIEREIEIRRERTAELEQRAIDSNEHLCPIE
jgi:hypothetical protein